MVYWGWCLKIHNLCNTIKGKKLPCRGIFVVEVQLWNISLFFVQGRHCDLQNACSVKEREDLKVWSAFVWFIKHTFHTHSHTVSLWQAGWLAGMHAYIRSLRTYVEPQSNCSQQLCTMVTRRTQTHTVAMVELKRALGTMTDLLAGRLDYCLSANK